MWSATTSAASAGTTKEHVILRPWHWAQHAADDRKGLLYYPVDGAIQVQDSASLEKCSTGATGLPWSNQVDSSISCAPSIYPSLSTIFTESLALTSSSGICFTFSLAWAWWHHFCLASLLFGMLVLTRTPYCRGKENESHIIKAWCTPKRCRVSLKDTSSLSTERNSRLWLHQSKLTQNLSIGFTAANCRTSRPTVEFPSLFVLFQCEPRTKRKLAAKLLHEDRETNNTPSHLPSSSFCKRRLSSANEIFVDSENGGALGFSCKAMVVSCRWRYYGNEEGAALHPSVLVQHEYSSPLILKWPSHFLPRSPAQVSIK